MSFSAKSWRLLITAVASFCAFSASSIAVADARELQMAPYLDQELIYEAGIGVVVSRAQYVVALEVQSVDRKAAWLNVSIFNSSDRSVTVYENAVEASGANGPLKVLRAADLMKKEKRRQMWENIATGLAASANSYSAAQAGNYNQRGTFQGRVNTVGRTGYSSSHLRGSYTAYGTDPAATQLALARANSENQQLMQNVRSTQLARSSDLASSLFRTETIEPGTSYGGALQLIVPKAPRGQHQLVEVVVTVNGERHPFAVFMDGTPSQNDLQRFATRLALPRPPVVDVVLGGATVEERRSADQQLLARVALLDISWTVHREFGDGPISGVLLIDDGSGSGIRVPWTIAAEPQHFMQEDAGIALVAGNADSDWLWGHIVSGSELTLKFQPN